MNSVSFFQLPPAGLSELKRIASTLEAEVDTVSSLLVRLLHVKDKRSLKAGRQSERLTAILKDYASKNGEGCQYFIFRRAASQVAQCSP